MTTYPLPSLGLCPMCEGEIRVRRDGSDGPCDWMCEDIAEAARIYAGLLAAEEATA